MENGPKQFLVNCHSKDKYETLTRARHPDIDAASRTTVQRSKITTSQTTTLHQCYQCTLRRDIRHPARQPSTLDPMIQDHCTATDEDRLPYLKQQLGNVSVENAGYPNDYFKQTDTDSVA